jgi:demethylmenaquinone methyltransferase/2-methoxy-6-polyprenyl-1,4-benzoquinol methylase
MGVSAPPDPRVAEPGLPGETTDATIPAVFGDLTASPAPRSGNSVAPAVVTEMFDEIAPVYDRLNTLMTLGADGRWRRAAADAARLLPGGAAIDVAAGTGKLAAALADRVGPFGRVLAVDISARMIEHGNAALPDIVQLEFRQGDALDLPASDGEFDAATIAFGLRNLPDFEAGFNELRRVVRPGGRVVCLELTTPRPRPWGRLFLGTFRRLAPLAGRVAGRSRRYGYLPASLEGFPDAEALADTMRRVGLLDIRVRRLGLGSVALHVGVVPGSNR